MEFYFHAMGELKTDAQTGGAIPWSAMLLYADTYGLDLEEFDQFVRNIRAMEKGIRGETEKDQEAENRQNDENDEVESPRRGKPKNSLRKP